MNAFKLFSENWTIDQRQQKQLEELVDPESSTFSALVTDYLRAFQKHHASKPTGCRSLRDMATARLYRLLKDSDDLDSELNVLMTWLARNTPVARTVFRNMPYLALRTAMHMATRPEFHGLVAAVPELRDLDEVILACEEDIRGKDNREGLHLVSIQELRRTLQLGTDSVPVSDRIDADQDFAFRRQPISAHQLPLLDEMRSESMRLRGSDRSLRSMVSQILPELEDVDWSCALLTGGIMLKALSGGVRDGSTYWSPIELRMYGIDAATATATVQQLYATWSQRVVGRKDIVKTADQIKFVSRDDCNRTIHIPLKVYKSETDALLDVTLDICAIGFDGNRALMLPRCARALETGYSILTTRLILGQPVLEAPLSKDQQIFKLAKTGYGVRILPSYANLLEDTALNSREPKSTLKSNWAYSDHPRCQADGFSSLIAYRTPKGAEMGLKTLRRIAFLGQDAAVRFLVGLSPLKRNPNVSVAGSSFHMGRLYNVVGLKTARNLIERTEPYASRVAYSTAEYTDLLEYLTTGNSVSYWLQSHPFESFVRACETQRVIESFDEKYRESYGRNPFIFADRYPPPRFWPSASVIDAIDRGTDYQYDTVEDANDEPFHSFIRPCVDSRTRGNHLTGYGNYLTARTRIWVVDDDSIALINQPLSLPLLITKAAEDELTSMLPFGILSPLCRAAAHEPGSDYAGGIPRVRDTDSEDGNMRYLFIDPDHCWRGFDDLEDEAFDITRIISYLTSVIQPTTSCSSPDLVVAVRNALCHRQFARFPQQDENQLVPGTLIRKKEAMIFKAWAMAMPPSQPRTTPSEYRFDLDYFYPVPEELFWGPEFEQDESPPSKRARVDPNAIPGVRYPWWYRHEAYQNLAR